MSHHRRDIAIKRHELLQHCACFFVFCWPVKIEVTRRQHHCKEKRGGKRPAHMRSAKGLSHGSHTTSGASGVLQAAKVARRLDKTVLQMCQPAAETEAEDWDPSFTDAAVKSKKARHSSAAMAILPDLEATDASVVPLP